MTGERYVPITTFEMDAVLVRKMGFERREVRPAKEWVYFRKVINRDGFEYPMGIKVLSTIHVDSDITRPVAGDAIHVMLMNLAVRSDKLDAFPMGFPMKSKYPKQADRTIYRTKSALINLEQTVRDMFRFAFAIACPCCSAPMIPRDSSRGRFFGCSDFPHCRTTKPSVEFDGSPLAA